MKQSLILIVDDTKDTVQFLADFLEMKGYRTLSAFSGSSGLEIIENLSPDAVLLDIGMPNMDGYDVLHRLKSDPRTKGIPVILCSAYESFGGEERALREGASAYLPKPFNLQKVLEQIQALTPA